MKPSRMPTSEECSANAVFERVECGAWHALFSPQFGGYCGPAAVYIGDGSNEESCFELVVWHDGEFPLGDGNPGEPIAVHCCSAEQFVRFGKRVLAMQRGEVKP